MRKKRGIAAAGLLICMAGLMFPGLSVHAEDAPLKMVNLEEGVTFELNEEGGVQFVNLHGNSVIIKDVPAEEGKTPQYHNIYIDKNRNGILDEDENEKVKLQYPDGTDMTDLPAGMPIYGLYQAKSKTPLRITMTGTGYGEIVGVCAGELLVAGEEPAVFMDMDVDSLERAVGVQSGTVSSVKMSLKGTATNCIGASSSTVDASGSEAAAILMDINCTSLSTCSAAQGSTITATAGQAVVVNIGSGQIGQCYGAQGGSIDVSGNAPAAVVMDVDCTNLGNCTGTRGCKVTTAGTVEKAVEATIRGGNISSYYGVQEESVHIGEGTTTAVAVNVIGGSVSGFFGVDQADILTEGDGKTAVDIAISGSGKINGGLVAAQGNLSSSTPFTLKGDVKLAVTTEASGDSNIYSGYLLQNNVVVDGSVTVNAEKMRLDGQFYLLKANAMVSGDVSLIMGEKSQGYLNGLENSTVEGNVTMKVYGADNSNRAGNVIVANGCASGKDYAVGGNLTVTMQGGHVNTFECAGNGANVKGNLTFCALEGGISRFTGLNSVSVGRDVEISTGKTVELTNGGTFYGCYSSQIGGLYDLEVYNTNTSQSTNFYTFYSVNTVEKNVTSKLHGGKYSTCNVSGGGSDAVVKGDYTVIMEDLEVTGNCYGINEVTILGNASVTMDKVRQSGYAALYGIYGCIVQKETAVAITNSSNGNQGFCVNGGIYGMNVEITTENNQFAQFYGIYDNVNVKGDAKIITKGDREITTGAGSYYGMQGYSSTVQGNMVMQLDDCAYSRFSGIQSSKVLGKTDIQVNGGAYTSSVTVIENNKNEKRGDITADFAGVTLGKEGSNWMFNNYLGGEGLLTCTVAEDCTLLGNYTVNNYYSGALVPAGGMRVDIGGDRHYGGSYPITEEVTVNNLYFGNGAVMQIPEGVTVTVADTGMIYAKSGAMILVEGTLKGSVSQEEDYQNGSFYINGGTLETDTEDIACLYYPLKVDYLVKGGTVSPEGCSAHPMSESNYGRAGYPVSFTCTPNKGYLLASATVKKASEDNPSDMEADVDTAGKYAFDMTKEAAEVKITFAGKQIVLGKTVQDPVAKLNEETTAEKPLYNMKDVTISNDGREGEVTYELDKTFGLPEGLVLADGRIYGTPTKAYEQGKKTVIKVTGKNDTVAELTLNIIVTAGDAGQTGQDGRILIDEENKEMNLLGSSVVLENNAGQTAVYLDDNLDGIADRDVPVYQGDLSKYTIYGIKDADFKKSIRITMNGGEVKAIYGSMASEITAADRDAVDIRILGGKINTEAAVISDTTVDGTVALTIGKDAECTSPVVQKGTSSYTGYYLNRQGAVSVGGSYTLRESLTADTVKLESSAVCTISKEVTLTAEQTTIGSKAELYNDGILNAANLDASYSSARLYNNGTLNATDIKVGTQAVIRNKGSLSCTGTLNNSGKLVMCGGTIVQEDNEWPGIYYPVTWETELKDTEITCGGFYTVEEEDKSYLYAAGGTSYDVSCTKVVGFDAYYIVNDTEPVLVTGATFNLEMPRQAVVIKIMYVPTDIEVQKRFADPVGVVGREYTAEEPLYDLTTFNIINDTNFLYGGDIRYRIANGSTLPQGLSLTGGKIVGTPKAADEEGRKVRITVTGRNGTSTDVELLVKIAADDSGQEDINDVVTYSGKIMDLHGHSVVICTAREDSTKTSVYLDENRDGIPDSMAGFKINGSMALDLSDTKVYGCQAKDALPEDTQISIRMQGGKVGELHGCYGTKSSPVTVDEVSVVITGGTVYDAVSGATYTSAKNINLDITGGSLKGNIYGANMPDNAGNVHFRFQERAKYENTNTYSGYCMYAVNGGTVAGNVEAMVGTYEDYYGFSGRATSYYGVYKSAVNGNVNYTIDGEWTPYVMNQFVYSSAVTGDVNVDWKSGYVTNNGTNALNRAFVRESTVDELNVVVGEEKLAYGDMSMSVGGTIRNLQYYIPDNVKQSPGLILLNTNFKTTINGYAYGYNRGTIQIAGNYTIDKDMDINELEILEGAKVTIAEGVTVTSNSEVIITGTLYNRGIWYSGYHAELKGTIENEGDLRFRRSGTNQTTQVLTIDAGGVMINRKTGECYFSYKMTNNGKIANYGTLSSVGYTPSGNGSIYTTELPTINGNPSNVYYAVSLDYPEYCIDAVTITDAGGQPLASSGIEGDTNQYLKGGSDFTINTGTVIEGITLSTITYGSDNRGAVTSDSKTWTGTLGKEPTVIILNFDGTVPISLAKTEDTVTGAQVGITSTADNPLYDMSDIEITGDTEIASGYVSYTVDKATPLPEGLSLVKGKIYGTPKKAGSTPQAVKIIVKGKNQTSAVFTLTFDSIEKGTPYLNKPQNLKIDAGAALSTVTLPKYTSPERCAGEYRWKDDTIIPEETAGTKEIEVEFVPVNTQDYDWSKIANSVYEDGVVTTTILLTVNKIAPTFEVPEGLTAVYGQTLGDIVLPEDANGTFSWTEDAATPVGDAGEQTFMLTYTPDNTDKYNTVNTIEVVVTVQPAKASFTPLESVHAVHGDTLADIILPDVEGGRYQWVTQSGIVPENGKSYQIIFKPDDLLNYNWAAIPGYSKARRGIVFNVTVVVSPYKVELSGLPAEITVVYGKTLADVKLPYVRNGKWYLDEQEIENPVISAEELPDAAFEWADGTIAVNTLEDMEVKVNFRPVDEEQYVAVENIKVTVKVSHTHSYEDEWKSDADNHWKECECGDEAEKAAHTWNTGTVTKQPTATEKGERTQTCTVCGATRIVEEPALGEHQHDYGSTWKSDANNHWMECECGNISSKAAHTWNAGTITKQPTATAKGEKTLTCTVCGRKKIVEVPATGNTETGNTENGNTQTGNTENGKAAKPGTVLKDTVTKAQYKVTESKAGVPQVMYMGITDKKQSSVTIQETIMLDGIRYNVSAIGKNAFKNNKKLKKVVIPKTVISIGDSAFYGCSKLSSVIIGANVETIGKSVFTNCSALKKITIPKKVKKIGSKAFYGCKKLTNITIKTSKLTTKTVGSKAFTKAGSSNYKKLVVKVPKSKLKSYKTMLWKRGVSRKAKIKK